MNAAKVKFAARTALMRYLTRGLTETCTADYTAVVYREAQSICVQWTVERKNGSLEERSRTFEITVGDPT